MTELTKAVIGVTTGKQTFDYTWRDIVLYALGVGAKDDEIEYVYEKDLKVIPTFGVVPYWGTFGITPYRSIPRNAVRHLDLDLTGSLHMTHQIVIHKPLDAMGAKLMFEDVITDLFDREGKGSVVRTELTAYDQSGEKVFTNIGDIYCKLYSAPGSESYTKGDVIFPERDPDFIEKDFVTNIQHLLYRLSGDTNLSHVDAEEAERSGFGKPIMQGLCTMGFACRMSIKNLFPKEPERLKRFGSQIRNILYPGTEIELQLWKTGGNKAYFRIIDVTTGKVALEKGFVEWE